MWMVGTKGCLLFFCNYVILQLDCKQQRKHPFAFYGKKHFMVKTAAKRGIWIGIEVKYINNNLYPLGPYYLWLIKWD